MPLPGSRGEQAKKQIQVDVQVNPCLAAFESDWIKHQQDLEQWLAEGWWTHPAVRLGTGEAPSRAHEDVSMATPGRRGVRNVGLEDTGKLKKSSGLGAKRRGSSP